jgi:regulator of sigma E protease
VERVEAGTPAERSGLQSGDVLVEIAGQDVRNPERFLNAFLMDVRLAPNQTKPIVVERDGRRIGLDLEIGTDPEDGSGVTGWQLGYGKPAVVVAVVPDSPAEAAGLQHGDLILGAGDEPELSYFNLRERLLESPDREIVLRVERGDEVLALPVTPRNEGGQGRIGAELGPDLPVHRELGIVEAARESLELNVQLSQTLLVVLKRLFSRELPLSTMSGPIGIARFAHEALLAGAQRFIWLLGFFSLQLGILNLLPIPVLDGGHILILGVEGVLRRDLSERVKERIMQVGFVFLLVFMGTIIALDIIKL